ncbi:hypothetical protein BD414DRAFT_575779 [Trametes punicea]|nr:hypothetical protein BD414DRAFT_575779 [Trametes punicea]
MATITGTPRMDDASLRYFFDRLATGDYHALAKELDISPQPTARSSVKTTDPAIPSELSTETSFDNFDRGSFEPTVEGLEAAVALLRGPASPLGRHHQQQPAPEDDEAFQFTFRLMIHQLYSLRDFAKMADDVVRRSQERFQPLPPGLACPGHRASLSFAFACADESSDDGESVASASTLGSASESTLASESSSSSPPSLWRLDKMLACEEAHDEEVRVLKKRCLGRKLSVVGPDADPATKTRDGAAWVFDAAIASAEPVASSPSYAAFLAGLPPMSPAGEPPMRYDYGGVPIELEAGSRKRRFSLLAASGL